MCYLTGADLLLGDVLLHFPAERHLAAKLADRAVVNKKEVGMVGIEDNIFALWHSHRVVRRDSLKDNMWSWVVFFLAIYNNH